MILSSLSFLHVHIIHMYKRDTRKDWAKRGGYSQNQKWDAWHRFGRETNFQRKTIPNQDAIFIGSYRWMEDRFKKEFSANIAVKYRKCGHWTSSVSTLTLPLPPGRDLCQRLNIAVILFACTFTHPSRWTPSRKDFWYRVGCTAHETSIEQVHVEYYLWISARQLKIHHDINMAGRSLVTITVGSLNFSEIKRLRRGTLELYIFFQCTRKMVKYRNLVRAT